MKKIVIVFALILAVSAIVAQTKIETPTSLTSDATKDLFDSYSDKVNASDIYTMEENFASIGYSENTNPFVAVGFEISPTMYFGAFVDFNFDDEVDDDGTTKMTTYASDYKLSFAFGVNNMGFSYDLDRSGTDTITNEDELKTTDLAAAWVHRLTFATVLENGYKIAIPLEIEHDLKTETVKGSITTLGVTTEGKEVTGTGGDVTVGLYPSVDIPLQGDGPLTNLGADASIKFAVYNATNLIDSEVTTSGTTTTTERDPNKKYQDSFFGIGADYTFEWDVVNRVAFKFKPRLGLDYAVTSDGQEQPTVTDGTAGATPAESLTTNTEFDTNLTFPIAVLFTPSDWFTLKMGAEYFLNWSIDGTTETNTDDASTYTNDSAFSFDVGFGFILAENFLLDFYYTTAFLNDLTFIPFDEILNSEIGIQFTYKF